MNRSEFLKFCENRIVFLDGATGTNLMQAGMPAGVCPEKWILEHRDVMLGLQKAYADAGSDIVYAPTFTGNRIKLADYGLADDIEKINTQLVEISKEAVGGKALVENLLQAWGHLQRSSEGGRSFGSGRCLCRADCAEGAGGD